jgi:hypothetical protein
VLEIANNEHKRTIMRMINEIKGEIWIQRKNKWTAVWIQREFK